MNENKMINGFVDVVSTKTQGVKVNGAWFNTTPDSMGLGSMGIGGFRKGDPVDIEYYEHEVKGKKGFYIVNIAFASVRKKEDTAKVPGKRMIDDSTKIIRQTCLKAASAFYSGMPYPIEQNKLFELAQKMEEWVNRQ